MVTAIDDENVDAIDLYLNGELVRREGTTPWDWSPQKGDFILDNLSPGIYELTATATTFEGSTYSVVSNFEITPAAFRVSGISLINTSDDTRFANFDPIDDSERVTINLDDLGSSTLSLIADYEGEVASVRFTLDNNSNFNTDSSAPYTFTANSGAWSLTPGEYEISATPFAGANASGLRGPGKTIQIRLEQARLTVDRTEIALYSSLNSDEGAQTVLRINNTGNTAGEFTVSNKPDWLSLSQESGSVAAADSVDITLTTPVCSQQSSETGELVITPVSNQNAISLAIAWSCDDRPEFDFVLERFYFNQAVPANDSLNGSEGQNIEVIKGRPGLARVFVSRNNTSVATLPDVVLNYRTVEGQTGSYVFEYPNNVPLAIDEARENLSYNTLLPAEFFQPGTEFYVEVDAGNQVPEFFENNNRHPESGYLPLNIIDPSTMDIVFVPVIVGENGTAPDLNDSRIATLMNRSEAMLPLEDYSFVIRSQSLTYTGSSWGEALRMINDVRLAEDRSKFYHGMLASGIGNSNTAGIAYLSARAALSRTFSGTIAHEFGHNLSLSHTNCGGPEGPEPDYPHDNARTGNWGYDIKNNELMSPSLADFMSYCGPTWIGSFNFKKMLDYRGGERSEQLAPLMYVPYATVVIDPAMLTGSINGNTAEIDQVFNVIGEFDVAFTDEHRIELIDANGDLIYEAGFTPLVVDHEDVQHFTIALPTALLQDTGEIKILRANTVLMQTNWLTASNTNLMKVGAANVTRLDDNRVEIQWPGNGRKALWVTDLVTNYVLTIDKSGRVVVHTQNNRLELKYTEMGQEVRQVVDVQK